MSNFDVHSVENWLKLPSKTRWKLFRQFHSPGQIATEHGSDSLSSRLEELFAWTCVRCDREATSHKMLLRSVEGVQCEAVALLPPRHPKSIRSSRATACISSQPGCGVGCPFCATGQLGYRGNLTALEIVEQVYWAGRQAAVQGRHLRNVVFMGMGEPLHNLANVLRAVEWLTDGRLFGISARRITVSTVGVPHAMLQLAQRFPDLKLALSLHAVDRTQRRMLVPKAVSDTELLRQTIRSLNAVQSNGVWLEVVLLAGVNDSLQHARQLIEFCNGLRVEVNLIPYNATVVAAQYLPSAQPVREVFANCLRAAGIRTTIRTSFGQSSSAACGQLRAAGK